MFCKNCGNEMNDDSKFCLKCGKAVGQGDTTRKEDDDNVIKYLLKPEYVVPYKILTTGLKSLLIAILLVLYFFEGSIIVLIEEFPEIVLIGIVVIVFYVIIKLVLEKKQYDDLEYRFYLSKMEYVDGFFNKEQKELKYKFIRETLMKQNILERIFNIGTIRITTNASSGYQNKNRHKAGGNGIVIHCVKDVSQQYSTIKQLIDNSESDDE